MTSTRVKSCDYCRQHRLRCDRLQREPEPCTECTKQDLCSEFSRSSVRNLTARKNPNRALRISSNETFHYSQYQRPATSHEESRPTLSSVTDAILLEPFDGPSQHIDGINVTPSQIIDHFTYFFDSIHPHFPFLASPFSISRTIQRSPLLFWSIMAISSRFKNRTLYKELQPTVRKLVADVLYPSGHGIETCQAMCLLCLWPFDAKDPNDDPSYLYAGVLSHLALRLGLHRPEFRQEFKNINDGSIPNHSYTALHEMWTTWCACKFVEHQLATKSGVPSGIREDWPSRMKLKSSLSSGGPATAPGIKNQLLLCGIRDQHLNALAYEGHTVSGLVPLTARMGHLQLFVASLKDFEATNTPLDVSSAIFLQATHITIAGFCLGHDILDAYTQECHKIILRGIEAASTVLDLIAPLAWETLPVHTLRAVLYAGVFAAQLRRMKLYLLSSLDPVTIIERATDFMRHLAYGNDFPTRAKIVLEAELRRDLSASQSGKRKNPSGVLFQARMGANMYWDLVENDKDRHNWSQDAEGIYWELLVSGVFPSGL